MKYVQTVCGPISPENMGFTLPHEHIFWNLSIYLPKDLNNTGADDPRKRKIAPEVLGDLKYHLHQYPDNVLQNETNVALKELQWFKEAGGGTICDCTVRGIHPEPVRVKAVSEQSGVNIIIGTGYYCHNSLPPEINALDKYDKAEQIIKDLKLGIDNTDIRAGFIKVGLENSMPDADRQSLAAAAIAQKETGAAILIHQPGIEHKADDIFQILTDNGADLSKTVMCHCDPLLPDHDYIDHMAKSGVYISFDYFGLEIMLGKTFWLPTDKERIFAILKQIDRGNLNKLLASHDTVYKSMLRQFGGFGYAHLQKDITPIMLANGYMQEWIDQITIHNPIDVFSLDSAKL